MYVHIVYSTCRVDRGDRDRQGEARRRRAPRIRKTDDDVVRVVLSMRACHTHSMKVWNLCYCTAGASVYLCREDQSVGRDAARAAASAAAARRTVSGTLHTANRTRCRGGGRRARAGVEGEDGG